MFKLLSDILICSEKHLSDLQGGVRGKAPFAEER